MCMLTKRNPVAKALRADPRYRKQTVKPKKGAGSYSRKKKDAE